MSELYISKHASPKRTGEKCFWPKSKKTNLGRIFAFPVSDRKYLYFVNIPLQYVIAQVVKEIIPS